MVTVFVRRRVAQTFAGERSSNAEDPGGLVFEHVTILLSFVYAVALTHLLSSATELLIAGKRVRFSGLYAVWVLNVLQPWLWRDGERISSEPCGGRENPRRLCAISFSRHAPTCAAKSRSYRPPRVPSGGAASSSTMDRAGRAARGAPSGRTSALGHRPSLISSRSRRGLRRRRC